MNELLAWERKVVQFNLMFRTAEHPKRGFYLFDLRAISNQDTIAGYYGWLEYNDLSKPLL